MKVCGTYSRISVRNCKRFLKKGNRNINGGKLQWETDNSSAPFGWKSRVTTDGRKFYLMPDGNQFPFLFSAFQYMVKNDYLLSQINVIRSFLQNEGWQFDSHLPSGWQVKEISPDNFWFIGRYGEFFENTKKATYYIEADSDYKTEELDIMKENFFNSDKHNESPAEDTEVPIIETKLKLKLHWFQHETLPAGWKIRKVLNTNGLNSSCTEVDIYLSPNGSTINGRKNCWQYMNDNGYTMEDIEKVWKFNWKTENPAMNVSPKRRIGDSVDPWSKRIKGS